MAPDTSAATAVPAEALSGVLKELARRAQGVRGSVVVDPDGLPIASDLDAALDLEEIAAVASQVSQAADSVFGHMGLRSAQVVLMEGHTADIAVMDVGDEGASMLVLLDKRASLGLVKLQMREAVARICGILGFSAARGPRITELFIIHRSGILLRHYSDTLRTEDERDILGGMLVAVQQFVKEALGAKTGELEEFRYGRHTVTFVRGAHTVAAVVVDGGGWEGMRGTIVRALGAFEARYTAALERWDGHMDVLHGMDECFSGLLRQ